MERSLQNKLLLYLLISAFAFLYLVLPVQAGISVPVFVLLQYLCLRLILPERNRLCCLLPVFILSLNSFLSGNPVWHMPNFLVCAALYVLMVQPLDLKDASLLFLRWIAVKLFEPLFYLHLPFVWLFSANREKAALIKRIFVAVLITAPSVVVLIALLSSADLAFSKAVNDFFNALFAFINAETFIKTLFSLLVGFYLFGLVYSAIVKKEWKQPERSAKKGDPILFNVLLVSILAIYTVFVVVQFKYLFAGAALPDGLTYTQYARQGFFEQLTLTGVNIAIIWVTVHFSHRETDRWSRLTVWLCFYLCLITVILLVSSFYRMWLYYADDGLTRLRFFVFGFLIFELFGLLITFFYILKPKFNLIAVYLIIGLFYYLLLNLVPVDYFVAYSQVNRCLQGNSGGIAYTLTLSSDAAPQIERLLYDDAVDETIKAQAAAYLERSFAHYMSGPTRWQRFNLSVNRLEQIYNNANAQENLEARSGITA
jgi:hypothetical protein